MAIHSSIRAILAATLAATAGCTSPTPQGQTPISQDELDRFLSSGRDARYAGITIYADPAGTRYEFANRVHMDRAARLDFLSPPPVRTPVVRARTATFVDCHLLLDSSARQNWLPMASVKSMDYRAFAPPSGEYPDHIVSDIPGYAGVANKLVLDELHIESPVFCVPPARGDLGPLARADERPADELAPKALRARRTLAARTHAVMGAALMRSFAFIRFDFPARQVRFSSHATFRPAAAAAVRACLPMRDWKGRPAVEGSLGGHPLLLVIDTAGDFDLALPPATANLAGPLTLGDWSVDDIQPAAHAALGLPEAFPARLGLGVLSRAAVTLDHKNRRVWFEHPLPPETDPSAPAADEEDETPVHYRGIIR